MKKAQGISVNTIIIAAIALIVLVVLVAVFAGRMGIWGKELDKQSGVKCASVGGTVQAEDADCADPIPGGHSDVGDTQICCRKTT